MNYLGLLLRILGIGTAGYAVLDTIQIVNGKYLLHGSQIAWLIIAGFWAVLCVILIWPHRD